MFFFFLDDPQGYEAVGTGMRKLRALRSKIRKTRFDSLEPSSQHVSLLLFSFCFLPLLCFVLYIASFAISFSNSPPFRHSHQGVKPSLETALSPTWSSETTGTCTWLQYFIIVTYKQQVHGYSTLLLLLLLLHVIKVNGAYLRLALARRQLLFICR